MGYRFVLDGIISVDAEEAPERTRGPKPFQFRDYSWGRKNALIPHRFYKTQILFRIAN